MFYYGNIKERSAKMTPEEAQKYIADLNYEEKLKLYELVIILEQKRQPAKVPQG